MEREAENDLPFSYNLACLLSQNNSDKLQTTWRVMEKGSEKSNPTQRCMISPHSIALALCQIREHIWRTSCNKIPVLKDRGFKLYLKEELYQFTQTVKARGVVYTLLQLSDEQKRKGVIAVSTGILACSLCHFGKKFGIPVTVVIPTLAADENIELCRYHADSQATIIVQGNDLIEGHIIALRIAKKKGLVYIDGNDHPNMIIGQATLGIEILEHLKKFDAVILPKTIKGCALSAAMAMAIKGWNSEIKIIEVRISAFDPLTESVRKLKNSPYELEIPVTKYIWHKDIRGIPNCWIDKVITVNIELIGDAIEHLLTENVANFIDFHTGVGLAAILSGELDELKKKRVLIPQLGKMDSINELEINYHGLMTLINPLDLSSEFESEYE